MAQGTSWQRHEAEDHIRELLDAAKAHGPQAVVDSDGVFEVKFVQHRQGLEELFSTPGPLSDNDIDP